MNIWHMAAVTGPTIYGCKDCSNQNDKYLCIQINQKHLMVVIKFQIIIIDDESRAHNIPRKS